MDDVTLAYAKEHLDELVARAAAGEDVRIKTPDRGTIRLLSAGAGGDSSMRPGGRRLGLLSGKHAIPARLMEPMAEDELADWYGETA